MSDWNRDRSQRDLKPGDLEWRHEADRPWGARDDAIRGPRSDAERRAFEDRASSSSYAPAGPAPHTRHRGYRLGSYGRATSFEAPDYLEAGGGYGGELYDNAPYKRGYGDDRYGETRHGVARSRSYGEPTGGAFGDASAFPGENERLQRVSDGEADRGHLFGGGADSHRGRGPKGYTRSDTRIHDDVADALTADHWVDASDIDVSVKDAEVTLGGEVTHREDRRRAEDLAERVMGVKHVKNNLRVRS